MASACDCDDAAETLFGMPSGTTRYAKSGDVHIAYQVVGDGPQDLVFVPGIITHVELAWEEPRWAGFLERLASFSRLIVFDRRGAGMSDRVARPATLEERMDDVRAVLDAVGSERAALFGSGDAGAMFALFAATYPQRTSALVLYAPQPRWRKAPDYPWGFDDDQASRWVEDAAHRFSDPSYMRELVSGLAPSIANDEQLLNWLVRTWKLAGASPASVAMFRRMNLEIDVRNILPTIRVPTLVLHRAHDRFVPPAVGRYVASQIPGAEYQELEGSAWVPWFDDAESVASAVQGFLERVRAELAAEPPEPDRVLATVLFTDLVDSTVTATRLGDRAWVKLLQDHRALVRRQLARYGGREIDTAGDGFFATFDGPARAIRCARAIVDGSQALGATVRAGVHTGECEVADGRLAGIAVHIGSRVAALAQPGEVLVSSTVKDLVAGSGLEFRDAGAHELKGVRGEWRLYSVAAA